MREQSQHRLQPNSAVYFLTWYMDQVRQQRKNRISELVLKGKSTAHGRCFRTSATVPQSQHITTWQQLFDVHRFRLPIVSQQVGAAMWKDNEVAAHHRNLGACVLKSDPTLTTLEVMEVSVILGLYADRPWRSKFAVTKHFSLELQRVEYGCQHV